MSTLSRSFVVRRLSLARLERKLKLERHRKHASELGEKELPVLEPHLNLTGRQSGNLPRQAFPVCSVGMCLASELAHEESSLVMSQAIDWISSLRRNPVPLVWSLPEALHLLLFQRRRPMAPFASSCLTLIVRWTDRGLLVGLMLCIEVQLRSVHRLAQVVRSGLRPRRRAGLVATGNFQLHPWQRTNLLGPGLVSQRVI